MKFFHNDAPCKASAPLLADAGINLLNFGIQHSISEMRTWTDGRIALLGNIPPRDVLADGTAADVERAVTEMLEALDDTVPAHRLVRRRHAARRPDREHPRPHLDRGGGSPLDHSPRPLSSRARAGW